MEANLAVARGPVATRCVGNHAVRLGWLPLMEDEPAGGRACLEGSADLQGSGDQDLRLPLVVAVA